MADTLLIQVQDSLGTVAQRLFTIPIVFTPAATPTFSPPAGSYASAQTVSISSATGGATIFYTTDGSTPTTASTVYSGPIAVNASQTVKAIATASGFIQSAVGSAVYTITPLTALWPDPLPAGTVGTAYSFTLTATGGVPPYSFVTTAGFTLPAGLSLNSSTGVISGTPTTPVTLAAESFDVVDALG